MVRGVGGTTLGLDGVERLRLEIEVVIDDLSRMMAAELGDDGAEFTEAEGNENEALRGRGPVSATSSRLVEDLLDNEEGLCGVSTRRIWSFGGGK